MKKVSLELQQCGKNQGGIGSFAYEIAKRITQYSEYQYYGNYFSFLHRCDIDSLFQDFDLKIRENSIISYGVYRRLWDVIPIEYERLFGEEIDLSIFFNFVVPPRVKGKTLSFIHDLTYIRYPETMKRSNYRFMSKEVKRSVEQCELILTTSAFTKNEVHEILDVPKERIRVVSAAPSLNENSLEYSAVKNKYDLGNDYILFVGTIEPRKNLSRLIRAFDILKEKTRLPHKLLLVGGNGWNNNDIYETAANSKHCADIIFTGYITSEEKTTLYKNASLLVFPSLYEGFGMPPLEAMVCECPVVCSNTASLPEVAGDGACFVNPFDEETIAAGMMRVLEDKEYAEHLIAKGKEQANRFTWEKSSQKLAKICDEVLH